MTFKFIVTTNIDNIASMIELTWVDHDWRYFIHNTKGVELDVPIYQQCWRQVPENLMSDDAELVELTIN